MNRYKLITVVLSVTSLIFLIGAAPPEGGCGAGLDNRQGEPGIDVGGKAGADWSMTYSDQIEVRIKNAGGVIATHKFAAGAGGVFDLDGVKVDIGKLCNRADVACPHEVFPKQVTMIQPGNDLHLLYVDFNAVGPLKEVKNARLLGNVDSDDDFSVALGVGAATNGICGLLAVSYATGHIHASEGDPPWGTALDASVVTAYSGGCILAGSGGAAAAGLTVEIRVPFTGKRM